MTHRIKEPALGNTELLLEQMLPHIVRDGERVAFLVDAGTGGKVIARIRVMIMRKRKSLEARGRKVKRFKLHTTVHPETHGGKRYDCIVAWKSINESHMMSEVLEDILKD